MNTVKKKYLICLSNMGNGFCNPTILLSAISEEEARKEAKRLKPRARIGKSKEVNY